MKRESFLFHLWTNKFSYAGQIWLVADTYNHLFSYLLLQLWWNLHSENIPLSHSERKSLCVWYMCFWWVLCHSAKNIHEWVSVESYLEEKECKCLEASDCEGWGALPIFSLKNNLEQRHFLSLNSDLFLVWVSQPRANLIRVISTSRATCLGQLRTHILHALCQGRFY